MAKSFKYYLEQYCASLCDTKTTSLRVFARKLPEFPRLKEPLLLLAMVQGREQYLLSSIDNHAVLENYEDWIARFRGQEERNLEIYLASFSDGNRYKKCYLSWISDCSVLERDHKTLEKVSIRMNNLIKEKGYTCAQACRITGLNKGNFYAFLKGDVTKLSRKTAVEAYDKISCAV